MRSSLEPKSKVPKRKNYLSKKKGTRHNTSMLSHEMYILMKEFLIKIFITNIFFC